MSNSTQRMCFNGSLSNIIQVESGIPQGSCLGPLVFPICTNGLTLCKAHVSTYAAYSTIYRSASIVSGITATLNFLWLGVRIE